MKVFAIRPCRMEFTVLSVLLSLTSIICLFTSKLHGHLQNHPVHFITGEQQPFDPFDETQLGFKNEKSALKFEPNLDDGSNPETWIYNYPRGRIFIGNLGRKDPRNNVTDGQKWPPTKIETNRHKIEIPPANIEGNKIENLIHPSDDEWDGFKKHSHSVFSHFNDPNLSQEHETPRGIPQRFGPLVTTPKVTLIQLREGQIQPGEVKALKQYIQSIFLLHSAPLPNRIDTLAVDSFRSTSTNDRVWKFSDVFKRATFHHTSDVVPWARNLRGINSLLDLAPFLAFPSRNTLHNIRKIEANRDLAASVWFDKVARQKRSADDVTSTLSSKRVEDSGDSTGNTELGHEMISKVIPSEKDSEPLLDFTTASDLDHQTGTITTTTTPVLLISSQSAASVTSDTLNKHTEIAESHKDGEKSSVLKSMSDDDVIDEETTAQEPFETTIYDVETKETTTSFNSPRASASASQQPITNIAADVSLDHEDHSVDMYGISTTNAAEFMDLSTQEFRNENPTYIHPEIEEINSQNVTSSHNTTTDDILKAGESLYQPDSLVTTMSADDNFTLEEKTHYEMTSLSVDAEMTSPTFDLIFSSSSVPWSTVSSQFSGADSSSGTGSPDVDDFGDDSATSQSTDRSPVTYATESEKKNVHNTKQDNTMGTGSKPVKVWTWKGAEEYRNVTEFQSKPVPDWQEAKRIWHQAWEVHLYLFGGLYTILGLYTLLTFVRLWRICRLLPRAYFLALSFFLLLVCVPKAVYLLYDGYNSHETFHRSVDYFLYSISFPCLTSAFAILFCALLKASNMTALAIISQKIAVLVTIILLHFVLSITTDVFIGINAKIMIFIDQLFFILWGFSLFFGYAYLFRRLYQHAVKREKNAVQLPYYSSSLLGNPNSSDTKSKDREFTLAFSVKVTFVTAILGLIIVGLEIYAVVDVYKTFSPEHPQPWPWYLYQSVQRLTEVFMCAAICLVTSQPFRFIKKRRCCACCRLFCSPCAEICCCGEDFNRSDSLARWTNLDHQQSRRTSGEFGTNLRVHLGNDRMRNGHNPFPDGGCDVNKTRIYFSDKTDIVPIMTSQPSSVTDSRPTSLLEDGQTTNTPVSTNEDETEPSVFYSFSMHKQDPFSSFTPDKPNRSFTASTPMNQKVNDGMVNSAYAVTVDDVKTPDDAVSKSRKSSLASSEFFYGTSSLSLAGSMASELEKAFRSFRENSPLKVLANGDQALSTQSLPSLLAKDVDTENIDHKESDYSFGEGCMLQDGAQLCDSMSSVDHIPLQETQPLQSLSKSNEDIQDDPQPWHHKLFRSGGDRPGGARTKDIDNTRYMLLLDLEQKPEESVAAQNSQSSSDRVANLRDQYDDNYKVDSSDVDSLPPSPTGSDIGDTHSVRSDADGGGVLTYESVSPRLLRNGDSGKPLLRSRYDDDSDDIEV